MMLIADAGLAVDQQIIDIMTGEQYGESFTKINPSGLVSVLEDGYHRLIKSSAILRCLAGKSGTTSYPTDPQAKAKVNEVMDWFNTNFHRTFGYGLVYPEVLDHVKLPDETANKLLVAAARPRRSGFSES